MIKSNTGKIKLDDQKQYPRLPCRGCTRLCKNYGQCDGKLWRLLDTLADSQGVK